MKIRYQLQAASYRLQAAGDRPGKACGLRLAACSVAFMLLLANLGHSFDIAPYRPVLDRAVDLTVRQHYDSVITIFDSLISDNPHSPVGCYFKMMTLEARMIDYENLKGEEEFYVLYDKCNELLDSLLESSEQPWYLYFKGALYISYGLHKMRFAEYFSGGKKFIDGVSLLERCYKKDSTIVDALFYISLYQYAKHQVGELFSWLTFWSKKTDRSALALVDRCARESMFSREIAKQVLVGLYTREKEYMTAETIALEFLKTYPECRSMHWLLATLYEKSGQPKKAVAAYTALDSLVSLIPGGSPYNTATILLKTAAIHMEQGDYQKCLDLANNAERLKKQNAKDTRLKKTFKQIKKIKHKAKKGLDHEKK